MSFFTGFGVSATIYYLLNRLFPVTGVSTKFEEVDVSNYVVERSHHDSSSVSDVGSKDDKDPNVAE